MRCAWRACSTCSTWPSPPWRDRSAFAVDAQAPRASNMRLVVKALLLNILNPKLTLFFLAFCRSSCRLAARTRLAHLLGLSGVFMAMTFAVFVAYGSAGPRLPPHGD